uniref:C2H2-type domain-containing protein n=1 Tax=Steinernema glaseri TaxID=37863 RepID=A0A1I8A6L9_9BILA
MHASIPDLFATVMRELAAPSDVPLGLLAPQESPNKPEDALFFQTLPETNKRRRRFAGNSDNTLDGLVARKAEKEEPISKRYKNEKDAIETPNEEDEQKRLETDPDVNTRTCSVCGYKGKWVSEMIRHKRVHTNARPFKCKFCSRTSKWKADLIRHVAKTHGIRVVSKFSRSKAFEASERPMEAQNVIVAPTPRSVAGFRCLECAQEQESFELIAHHLQQVHNLATHSCAACGAAFDSLLAAEGHSCSAAHLRVHYATVCRPASGQSSDAEESPRSSSEDEAPAPSSLLFPSPSLLAPATSSALPLGLYPSLLSSLCTKPAMPMFPQVPYPLLVQNPDHCFQMPPVNVDLSLALLQLQNLSSQMFLSQLAMAK